MDPFRLIAMLATALAWPVTALLIVLILRRPITDLIPLITTIKYKDFEIDFARRMAAATGDGAALDAAAPVAAHAFTGVAASRGAADPKLLALAQSSPQQAILDAWSALHAAVAGRGDAMTPAQAAVYTDLRDLRDSAAAAPRFAAGADAASQYVRLAARLRDSLGASH